MEQIKPIKITVGNEEYILRFTRKTMLKAEQEGFDIQSTAKPASNMYDLFYYALLADRPMMKKDAAMNLLDSIGGVLGVQDGFWTRLCELYQAPLNTLTEDGTPTAPQVTVEL
ncbi:MAG: DUF5055 domain-containing protein [Clostridia bacterium]|nr:DUF5055 domain-containing protein [Clostridia bacterium]